MAAPTIISDLTASVAENGDYATSILTDEPIDTMDITGGADAAFFTLSAPDLYFIASPDFESPADADLDNVYEVEITVANGDGSDVQTLLITVTDIDESPPEIITTEDEYEVTEGDTFVATFDITGNTLGNGVSGPDAALFFTGANSVYFNDPAVVGVYHVTLVADGDYGSDTLDLTVTVVSATPSAHTRGRKLLLLQMLGVV